MIYLSFGASCQPAYQIRRVTGDPVAYFFDWLITTREALRYCLREFDPDSFLAREPELCDGNMRVLDSASGIKFQHDFPSQAGRIDPMLIAPSVAAVREKYLRRRERLLAKLAGNCVAIRYEWGGASFAANERQAMTSFRGSFEGLPGGQRLFVLASEDVSATRVEDDQLYFRLAKYAGPEGDRWKGDDASWNALFRMATEIMISLPEA